MSILISKSSFIKKTHRLSAKSCISELWKEGNIEQKGIFWSGSCQPMISPFVQYWLIHDLALRQSVVWHSQIALLPD